MVWKNVKKYSEEEANYISKRAVKKKVISSNTHTRKAKELNVQSNCKKIVEKKLGKKESKLYNQILDEERVKNKSKY